MRLRDELLMTQAKVAHHQWEQDGGVSFRSKADGGQSEILVGARSHILYAQRPALLLRMNYGMACD